MKISDQHAPELWISRCDATALLPFCARMQTGLGHARAFSLKIANSEDYTVMN